MKILLSGASSFTGYWFGKALSQAGHQVTGLYQAERPDEYNGVRRSRVDRFRSFGECIFGCSFGEKRFLQAIRSANWDLYCHHAAQVKGYRSADFDPIAATAANTHNLTGVLEALEQVACGQVVVTGSVFERGEGQGGDDLAAITSYGLSKTLTWEILRHEALKRSFTLGKFVIPNPFGPLEEPRFTAYLARTWSQGERAICKTPNYIRDNIPVDLLSQEYLRYIRALPPGLSKHSPSCFVASQADFTHRVASEFRKRTDWACEYSLASQTEFLEPITRVNIHSALRNDWDEKTFWDDFVEYHRSR